MSRRFLLPPPLWGRVGVGGRSSGLRMSTLAPPPPPTPSHKGEGGRARLALACASAAAMVAGLCAAAWAQPTTPPPPAPPPAKVTIGFVEIEGDARHEPLRAYERLILKTREHPFAGAQVGIEETTALVRVLRTEFALERITVKSAAEVAPAVTKAQERGINFFILDTPAEAFKPLAAAVKGRDALLFNATAPEDSLRREVCAREIVHTLPSQAMLSDGLMQHLASRKWRDILVLQGPAPADALVTKAFENSAKKFGARIVANKQFKAGTDPRERELNNPALLTAGTRDYDVLFIADDAFEF